MSEEKIITKETSFEESVVNTQASAAKSLIHETLHFDESIADEYGAARAEQAEANAEQISTPAPLMQNAAPVQNMPVQNAATVQSMPAQKWEEVSGQKQSEMAEPVSIQQTSGNQNSASTMTGTAENMEQTTYEKESAEDQSAEKEYTEAVKDPEERSEKIKQIKNLFTHSTRRKFSREEVILSRISDDQLMEYLTLEQRRQECLQKARESRNEKLLLGFQLAAVLCAIVGVVWLLKDNPVVLVNILYIIGIVIAIWIWKNPGKPGKH